MATVFLATQQSLGRKVALKIIADSAFGHQRLADRFAAEAKIIASFSHPHIVPVYDVGHIQQFHYLSMDYLPGGHLGQWIRSGLEPEEADRIVRQIALALHYAHSKGYIHRDVKPDNILFREDSSAVLTDFGIAQPINTQADNNTGRMVVGTPSYMSPEQSQGLVTDARTDIYSLGVMFYQMLTRQLPYHADSQPELALQHIRQDIPRLPISHRRYQPLIDKMLAKDPQQRFQSGLALCKALENLGANSDPTLTILDSAFDDLKIIDTDPHANADKCDFSIEDRRYRKLGLLPKNLLHCYIRSNEAQHFAILFGQFTTRLIEWRQQHGGKCAGLEFDFAIDPLLSEFAIGKINALQQDHENFDFLNKLTIKVNLSDLSGKPLTSVDCQ